HPPWLPSPPPPPHKNPPGGGGPRGPPPPAPAGAVETRAEAQAWLKAQGYRVPTVDIPAVTRLGARMFRANVAFDDHPFDRRMAGQIDTVTTNAVVNFVRGRDPQARVLVVE
ncbi:DUF2145 domain-containing protein, partial [Massilia sp. CT11-108]|uniref:DUF2145 domain-containing protein n=1 Tax=Massilia sp. CT11-108 TaxID=3393900 RepID=UPI0039A6149F